MRSPLQLDQLSPETKRVAIAMRLMARVMELHNGFVEWLAGAKQTVEEAKRISEEARNHLARITQLPRGEKGDRGEPGVRGRDGNVLNVQEIAEIVKRSIRVPKDGKDGADGMDADVDRIATEVYSAVLTKLPEPPSVKEIVNYLKKDEEWKEIARMKRDMAVTRSHLAGKVYGQNTWARGGGDTVAAGSGITITDNANGTKVISSSGAAPVPLTPTGTVNSMNTLFTVVSEPTSVVADGITYFDGAGYTYAALTITMEMPPSQWIRYYA